MKYRQQIEQAIGQPLPQMGEGEMPPEVMNQIAAQAAQATQQVTGQEQALIQAQQLQAQAAQTQPLVELKQAEIQQKAQSDQMKAEVDIRKQQSTEAIAEMKIAQQREEALMKEKGSMRKDYRDILKDVRDSDNKTKGI